MHITTQNLDYCSKSDEASHIKVYLSMNYVTDKLRRKCYARKRDLNDLQLSEMRVLDTIRIQAVCAYTFRLFKEEDNIVWKVLKLL
jgi:hypothetical protein